MEEAVTKKFVHEDSACITSLCGEIISSKSLHIVVIVFVSIQCLTFPKNLREK